MKGFRKLMLSICTLVLLITVFTTSTYAWFKITSTASVSGFDFKVTGGRGFLMSVDNAHFSSEIKTIDMKKAIILGYDSDTYTIDSDGDLAYNNGDHIKIKSEDDINQIIKKNIELVPVTSRYGYQLTDIYNNPVANGALSGRYVEFNLYFKAASDLAADNLKYDIQLFVAKETKVQEDTNVKIEPTYINSTVDSVELKADMETTLYGHLDVGTKGSPNYITVNSMNALRFSTEEIVYTKDSVTNEVVADTTDSVRQNHSKIYEFYDDTDLGSYAVKDRTEDIYNPQKSASFTYYNNIKLTDIEALDPADQPDTIRYKVGTDYNGIMPVITTVESGSDTKCVTFRFWLEGWDADCFDGLAESINVKLAFTAKES